MRFLVIDLSCVSRMIILACCPQNNEKNFSTHLFRLLDQLLSF
jgi:hypothetical protein